MARQGKFRLRVDGKLMAGQLEMVGQLEMEELHWYAFRIFRNGRNAFIRKLANDGVRTYVPEKVIVKNDPVKGEKVEKKPIFNAIVFVQTTAGYVNDIRYDQLTLAFPYLVPGTKFPAVIPDTQMHNFIEVLRLGGDSAEIYKGELNPGDKVRVTQGVFKDREGYVTRVKGNKKFVVAIEGVAAVATIYIPKAFLTPIPTETQPALSFESSNGQPQL